MIVTEDRPAAAGRLATLARDFQARIVNCSASGCLFETNARLDVGTIGMLRFTVDGRELGDAVQVVRCQPIEGAGSLFHVGAKFVLTTAPGKEALRFALGTRPATHDELESRRVQ